MYTFLLVILVIVSAFLIIAILMQAGKGGGLAANFGGSGTSDSFIGTRQVGNVLTKASWWLGGAFLGLSFILSLMSTRSRTPKSILDQPLSAPAAAPLPNTKGQAPAIPLEPVPTPATPPPTTPPTP